MKVIFLKEMPKVAHAGDIKEVADGYGRNYLLPKGLAALATAASTDRMKSLQKRIEHERALAETEMKEMAASLEGKELVFKAKAGSSEKLFGSITAADIAEELAKRHGVTVDKKKIEPGEPIKKLGEHEVAIRLAKDIEPKITVRVIAKETKEAEQGS
ncbi:MAG: 50S ribosomal protein L9 [Dehalococcoidia bacterium]|nr:MAG: 50S ribosomal protein L9 [Dehalococcoidia bacterium]